MSDNLKFKTSFPEDQPVLMMVRRESKRQGKFTEVKSGMYLRMQPHKSVVKWYRYGEYEVKSVSELEAFALETMYEYEKAQ